jgi:aspartate kinase
MKILVQKFGGTSVDTDEHRQQATAKVVRALQAGWSVVVVVSAIGRAGAPYATDTLVNTLKGVDPTVVPAPREMDMMMACGEIISTVVLAQTLRARGVETIALTGGQAGILTDYDFGNARILSIDPTYLVKQLEAGRVVLVAGFQGVTALGAITTLGRGGSDTTASALGAAVKPHADEVEVEIYTDVDGVKTADPRLVPEAITLDSATYEEVAEMAHLGAKVVHPRAAELANQYGIPLWVKSTFSDAAGTKIASDVEPNDAMRRRITGVTHTGKIVYLRFELPTENERDKQQIELAIYRMLQSEAVPLYLNSTDGNAFAFAVAREHLGRVRELLDGLVVPVELGARRHPPYGTVYLLGVGAKRTGFAAQKEMLSSLNAMITVHAVEAEVTENCTVVSVIAGRFKGVPGVMALILETLESEGVEVYQVADSELSISVLIREGDVPSAVRALHTVFNLGAEGTDTTSG